jgi:hypothetical protein
VPGSQSQFIVLQDKDGNLNTPVSLLRDEQGQLLYEWTQAPALAPEVSAQDLGYAEFNPEQELVWGQKDWSYGGLQFYYEPSRPQYYGVANKVWAVTPNELALGYSPHEITFGVRNGGVELGNTNGWTGSGTTLTAVTTAPYAGIYHIQAASMSTNDYASVTIQQTEQPVARWQSQPIVVHCKARGSESGGTLRLQIVESGGSSTPTTSGTGVSLSASYQDLTVGVTLQSDSTGVEVRVQMSADGGSDRTVYIDSLQCHAGAIAPNAAHVRMLVQDTDLILCTNRAVWKMDETNDYWALQHVHGAAITGAEIYDDILYVGQGESTAYEYSAADDPTSWTTSTLASTGKNANRFAKAVNTAGNWALAKSLNDDEIFLATDPTNSGTWGTAIEVGKDDHDIIQLYQQHGTLGVGKEDGFYEYKTLEGNRFLNVYPGAEQSISTDNFSRGLMHNGLFYTILGEVGLMRYDGSVWQPIDNRIRSPGFTDIGNRVRAFGTDGNYLFMIVEDLAASSISKESWLLSMKDYAGGEYAVHTLGKFFLSDAVDIMVYRSASATNHYLYINGDVADEAFVYRISLPNKTETPRNAPNADMPLAGEFITSYWDGNRAQVYKAFNRLTLISESLSSDLSVTVAYQVDDDTTWTNINSTNSIFITSPLQSIAFNEGVIGRRIRLRLTFASNAVTSTGVVKGFILETNWRPRRLIRWNMVVNIDKEVTGLTGVKLPLPPTRVLSQLRQLEQETSPIAIFDLDGGKHRGHIVGMRERQYSVRLDGLSPTYARGLELSLLQAYALSGEPWDSGIRWDEFHWG